MKGMTIEKIASVCGGRLVLPEGMAGSSPRIMEAEASCVVTDSRDIRPDGIFIAIKGEKNDGHDYIAQVFEEGALGVICEHLPEPVTGPCILAEDVLLALRQIGEYYRRQLDIKVVGITGSVGKTSTKEFIAGVLSEKFRVLKTEGNFNNEIGVPLTILRIRPEHQVAVVEMGINHFGEMHRLSQIARPDICVMTNIGQCHLESLGSREGILKAKSEIFDFANPEGAVVVNGDDDMLATVTEVYGKKPIRFGRNTKCDFYADEVQMKGLDGSSVRMHVPDGGLSFPAQINLPGLHQIYNALAAAAVAKLLGLSEEEIAVGTAKVETINGRDHLIRTEDYVILDDCYNANPMSMKAAIDVMTYAAGRKVAVLGDMFELGRDERKMHEEIGAYCVEKGIHLLLCAGERSEYMARAAEAIEVHHYATREELQKELPGLLRPGDAILVKASHGMHFEKIVAQLNS